ncbi:hypothetical protein B0H10DRAFT_1952988 [Mycena sp. CBHHK59/15]|nr:hypothetical protein B0H10DRAFT_1952988 [Mycena sp. CBHHK59/15]
MKFETEQNHELSRSDGVCKAVSSEDDKMPLADGQHRHPTGSPQSSPARTTAMPTRTSRAPITGGVTTTTGTGWYDWALNPFGWGASLGAGIQPYGTGDEGCRDGGEHKGEGDNCNSGGNGDGGHGNQGGGGGDNGNQDQGGDSGNQGGYTTDGGGAAPTDNNLQPFFKGPYVGSGDALQPSYRPRSFETCMSYNDTSTSNDTSGGW